MKREIHAIPAAPISENSLCEALDLDGYIVVTQALDERWLVRLRLAFENAPVQSSGTQHVEILEDTPELDAWLELAHHPALVRRRIMFFRVLIMLRDCMEGIRCPDLVSRVFMRIGRALPASRTEC